jgi:hypothetical protein
MKRRFWTALPLVVVVACAGDSMVGPEPAQIAPPVSANRIYQYYVDGEGYPVYPGGTPPGRWVDAGTWLKIAFGSGFSASSQYSIPVLLGTTIRGNSSQGWSRSSNDGLNLVVNVPKTIDIANLSVPADKQDCTMSAVTLWGTAEHTASYKLDFTVVGAGAELILQVDSRETPYPNQTCQHTPTSGEVVGPDKLGVGQSATVASFFRWASPVPGDCLNIVWSSNNAALTISASANGAPDARLVTGQHSGTADVSAVCNGFTVMRQIEVTDSPEAPCDDLMTDTIETCDQNPPKETKAEDGYQETPNNNYQWEDQPTKTVCWVRFWYERWGNGDWFYRNTEVLYCWQEAM